MPPAYDPGIDRAVRELNRITGVRTRASCQGKARPDERSTHGDLAYVAFAEPLPITVEEHLVLRLGGLARLSPDDAFSAWPDRNDEFCRSLAVAAEEARVRRQTEAWREHGVPTLVREIVAVVDSGEALDWCLDCRRVSRRPHAAPCRAVHLIAADPDRRAAIFRSFVAADPNPPDARLREHEGDAAVVERAERGDFGHAYRRAWRAHVTASARRMLREDARRAVAAARARGLPVDFYFERGRAVIASLAR